MDIKNIIKGTGFNARLELYPINNNLKDLIDIIDSKYQGVLIDDGDLNIEDFKYYESIDILACGRKWSIEIYLGDENVIEYTMTTQINDFLNYIVNNMVNIIC